MKPERETYGEWRARMWRTGEAADFTRAERREMSDDDAWTLAHASEARMLDRYVGRRVSLLRAHPTFAVDVLDPYEVRGIPRYYARGTEYVVRIRVRDRLLARAESDGVMTLLAREWVTIVDRRMVRAPRRLTL